MSGADVAAVAIREEVRPGDLGRIVALHGEMYAREYGWDVRFEAYVAETVAVFARSGVGGRDRLWLAEAGARLVGCIGIVTAEEDWAQLRWFLVDGPWRGSGLGRRLLDLALAHCRSASFGGVFLLTVAELARAARLYESAGFTLVSRSLAEGWGRPVVAERYGLRLHAAT